MRRALIAAVAALLTLPAAAQAEVHGAVGGLRDPAAGTLQLNVRVTETTGVGVRRATAMLGGHLLDSQYFADPACAAGVCPTVATVDLAVPTAAVPDGTARLEVRSRTHRYGHACGGSDDHGRQQAGGVEPDRRGQRRRRREEPAVRPERPGRTGWALWDRRLPLAAAVDVAGPAAAAHQARRAGARRRAQIPLPRPPHVPRLGAPQGGAARHARAGARPPQRALDRAPGRTREDRRGRRRQARPPPLVQRHLPRPRRRRPPGERADPDPCRPSQGSAFVRSLVLAALALAVVPAAAQAQDTDVGGKVPSVLELTLSDVSLGRLPRTATSPRACA